MKRMADADSDDSDDEVLSYNNKMKLTFSKNCRNFQVPNVDSSDDSDGYDDDDDDDNDEEDDDDDDNDEDDDLCIVKETTMTPSVKYIHLNYLLNRYFQSKHNHRK